ncbi:hypothetical protein HOLleu_06402 [Holothuria leucospilota]|uniref:Uncharacterized protein n=1 Tax=Holothuria leucospilota TaxID=206669 RepID=A0A9Q1HJL8_HOLLE|nr:hypothetical protein HOLleu_06402 [Holothuria leucospilota]
MTEPRITIRNVESRHLLYVASSRNATTSSKDKEGKENALFKVQCCEKMANTVTKTVLIRTFHYPNRLLDVRDLRFEGRVLDMHKRYDKDRWWKMTWLEVAEGGMLKVLFQSYTNNSYLAEKEGGAGVEVIQLDNNDAVNDVPDRAKWELTIGGLKFKPDRPGGVYLGLSNIINELNDRTAVTRVAESMAITFTATPFTTLTEAVDTTDAIAAGETVDGISATTARALSRIVHKASKAFFVSW